MPSCNLTTYVRIPCSAQKYRNKFKEKICPLSKLLVHTHPSPCGFWSFLQFSKKEPKPVGYTIVLALTACKARLVELRGRHLPPYPHPPHPHAVHIRMLLWHSPIVRSSKNLVPLANEYNRQKIGQQRHKTDQKWKEEHEQNLMKETR